VDLLAWRVCNETVVWRTFKYHRTFFEAVWTTPVTPALRQQGDESVVDRWDGKVPIGPGTASATRRTGVREITDAGLPCHVAPITRQCAIKGVDMQPSRA